MTTGRKVPPRSVTVTLGGEAYKVDELPVLANAEWLLSLEAVADEIFVALDTAAAIGSFPTTAEEFTAILRSGNIGALIGVGRAGVKLALTLPKRAIDLLYSYSPNLVEYRDEINAQATTSEVIAAFGKVLVLAIPLGGLIQVATAMQSPSPSSPSPTDGLPQNGTAPAPLPAA
jgi:hypothetical protein